MLIVLLRNIKPQCHFQKAKEMRTGVGGGWRGGEVRVWRGVIKIKQCACALPYNKTVFKASYITRGFFKPYNELPSEISVVEALRMTFRALALHQGEDKGQTLETMLITDWFNAKFCMCFTFSSVVRTLVKALRLGCSVTCGIV